jgi:histone deacetylase 1/2
MMSKGDDDRRDDYIGINGETCWILVTDHFTGMKHGDSRLSKGPPLQWLAHFLAQYSPSCPNKYVYLDQGGELFNNTEVRNLFAKKEYAVFPTGADNSSQNGPVERGHRTLGNTIRALLTGANLPIKFWPYAFYHALRMSNALPSPN